MLFDKNVTEQFYFAIKTLEESSTLISHKYREINSNQEFDKITILEAIKLQIILQYIETVGAYCLACQKDNFQDFNKVLSNYRVSEVHNFFSNILQLSNTELNEILSFYDSSYWISGSDIIEQKMQISRDNLKNKLIFVKNIWDNFHGFYNSSKHSGRWHWAEFKDKVSGEQQLVLQWIDKNGINTNLYSIEDLNSKILHTAKICNDIMAVIYFNRELSLLNNPPIDANEFIHIE